MAPSRRRSSRSDQAFTLIELLVVIAIIAILTAILLPVFASVREGSRQGVAISNMKDIQQKMEQFKLDNHKYPDVLFGYVYHQGGNSSAAVVPMSQALAQVTADHQADINSNQPDLTILASRNPANYFPGLYPAYIKDPNEFTDPNNTLDANAPPASQATAALDVNVVAPCNGMVDSLLRGSSATGGSASGCPGAAAGKVVPTYRTFYKLDAYDSGPKVTAGNQVDATVFYPRYQLAREGTVCPQGGAAYCDEHVNTNDADYKRQLRWQNPPADTVVTMTSYHVQNADKVLLMFQSGAVKKLRAEDFQVKEGVDVEGQPTYWRYPQQ